MIYMATVESLGKLERRLTLSFPLTDVQAEVEKRLKQRARTAKAPGFRPGKVPLKMIAAQYGYQIETDVLNDKVGRAFNDAATENNLRVAGYPKIEPRKSETEAEGLIQFDATFEIYPEIAVGDLAGQEVEKVKVEVSDTEISKTIEILRKQRVHYHTKGQAGEHGDGGEAVVKADDRVTIDFAGTIDGVPFEGGKADNYVFVMGEGRMMPEFEAALTGMKVGESRVFPLVFPAEYHAPDVAGKTAEFTITLNALEWPHLPEVDGEFAMTLGVTDGDMTKMREEIKVNLEREVGGRVKSRNKESVMDLLIKVSELDVPKVLVDQDVTRLAEMARADMAQRGMNVKDITLPPELFNAQAERRVRLGLILAHVVKEHNLYATPEQVKAQVEDFAQSYEDPREVLKYYYSDRQRLAEVEALVLEENVVNYVLGQSKVVEKLVDFDELMANNAQA
jgi:trigger factor